MDTDVDALTGLYNRAYAINKLHRIVDKVEVIRTVRPSRVIFSQGSVGIILVDIYKLRLPHDKYGHPPIDRAIRDVGQLIQSFARAEDSVCRYGGDEFLLMMPGTSKAETERVAQQLRQSASQIRIKVADEPREEITLSVGAAHYPSIFNQDFASTLYGAEALLRIADEALEKDRIRNTGLET